MTANTTAVKELLVSTARILSYHEAKFIIIIECKDGTVLTNKKTYGSKYLQGVNDRIEKGEE